MKLEITIAGGTFGVDLDRARSLAIPLRFGGPQPVFFGAPGATAQPLDLAGFIGDTRQGGSCNVAEIRLVPHCNGTHTESVGHILRDGPSVNDALPQSLMPALLISVTPDEAAGDRLITRRALETAAAPYKDITPTALIVRTLPNDGVKLAAVYDEGAPPPFFAADAMAWLVGRDVRHLLVDFPSIDRMHDEGRLANHRIFWNLADGAGAVPSDARGARTVTEMIFVDDDISDGPYLLNLQVPAFVSDAAPSRPVIYPLVAVS